MQLMTFNEILTKLCDDFDELIAPKAISRRNTNIIYLIFKAVAKGLEVINNVCAVVSHKFDPSKCSEEDLMSVSALVGTELLKGSSSGLDITITNNGVNTVNIASGLYHYALDDDTTFTFEITPLDGIDIEAKGYISVIAMSDKIGVYPVTEQASISITSKNRISSDLTFSCSDNTYLLGTENESLLDFRKRILTDNTRQDAIVELQTALRNLPYLYDCRCIFNNKVSSVEYDGYTIPSGYMLIFYSGAPRNEVAEVIAKHILCNTVSSDNAFDVTYQNEIFVDGKQIFHLIPFSTVDFKVKVNCVIDEAIADKAEIEAKIRSTLFNRYRAKVHSDYIKENDIYNVIESLDIDGVDILGVDLIYGDGTVDYITVPLSRIPSLIDVLFE